MGNGKSTTNETTKKKGKKDKHNEQINKITNYWPEPKQEAQNLTKTDDDNIEQNNEITSIQYSNNKLNESSSMTLAVSISAPSSSLPPPSMLPESVSNILQNGGKKELAGKALNFTNKMKHRGINDNMITELCNWIIANKDKIDTLYLSENQITSKGASGLFKSFTTSNITFKHVYLGMNDIDDECIDDLGKYIQINKQIESIGIGNMITDDGIERLSQYINNNNTLKYVDIQGNKGVTDVSVKILVEMKNKSKIIEFMLNGTSISEEKQNEFEIIVELSQEIGAWNILDAKTQRDIIQVKLKDKKRNREVVEKLVEEIVDSEKLTGYKIKKPFKDMLNHVKGRLVRPEYPIVDDEDVVIQKKRSKNKKVNFDDKPKIKSIDSSNISSNIESISGPKSGDSTNNKDKPTILIKDINILMGISNDVLKQIYSNKKLKGKGKESSNIQFQNESNIEKDIEFEVETDKKPKEISQSISCFDKRNMIPEIKIKSNKNGKHKKKIITKGGKGKQDEEKKNIEEEKRKMNEAIEGYNKLLNEENNQKPQQQINNNQNKQERKTATIKWKNCELIKFLTGEDEYNKINEGIQEMMNVVIEKFPISKTIYDEKDVESAFSDIWRVIQTLFNDGNVKNKLNEIKGLFFKTQASIFNSRFNMTQSKIDCKVGIVNEEGRIFTTVIEYKKNDSFYVLETPLLNLSTLTSSSSSSSTSTTTNLKPHPIDMMESDNYNHDHCPFRQVRGYNLISGHKYGGISCLQSTCLTYIDENEEYGSIYISDIFSYDDSKPFLNIKCTCNGDKEQKECKNRMENAVNWTLWEILIRYLIVIAYKGQTNNGHLLHKVPYFMTKYFTKPGQKKEKKAKGEEDDDDDDDDNGDKEEDGDNDNNNNKKDKKDDDKRDKEEEEDNDDDFEDDNTMSKIQGKTNNTYLKNQEVFHNPCPSDLWDKRRLEYYYDEDLEGDAILISENRTGPVYRQSIQGWDTVFKLLYLNTPRRLNEDEIINPEKIYKEMRNECKVYKKLRKLQGSIIPIFLWFGELVENSIVALITEYSGESFDKEEGLNIIQAQNIRKVMNIIHKAGIIHGDIRIENFLKKSRNGNGNENEIVVIDFAFSIIKENDMNIDDKDWINAVGSENKEIDNFLCRYCKDYINIPLNFISQPLSTQEKENNNKLQKRKRKKIQDGNDYNLSGKDVCL